MITGGGIVILIIIAVIVLGIIFIRRWRSGQSISLTGLHPKNLKNTFKREKADESTELCFNIYPNKIVGEYMLRSAVVPDTDEWELGNKRYKMQGKKGKDWLKVVVSDEVLYPAERLARMMGCMPLRKFKSFKFNWYEKLAPYAPVVALIIVGLLFYLMAN